VITKQQGEHPLNASLTRTHQHPPNSPKESPTSNRWRTFVIMKKMTLRQIVNPEANGRIAHSSGLRRSSLGEKSHQMKTYLLVDLRVLLQEIPNACCSPMGWFNVSSWTQPGCFAFKSIKVIRKFMGKFLLPLISACTQSLTYPVFYWGTAIARI